MKMVEGEEMRKGPWTEQEDVQLMCFVGLFGDRRWDFIAKVSGLNRSGKSCRLRWVNYLHPGLKRGKMTPQEQRLVLELHAKWGNRWSKIARKLPGRTDNEIKNYWRTHVRKKAQEKRRAMAPSSSSSSSNSCSTNHPTMEFPADSGPVRFFDSGGTGFSGSKKKVEEKENQEPGDGYSMEDIWKDIDLSDHESLIINPTVRDASPSWDCCQVSLWGIDEEERKSCFDQNERLNLFQTNQIFFN